MSPDGFPPLVFPDTDGYDPTRETEMVACAVFAQQHSILSKEVDALLDARPDLWAAFDVVMDFVARDALIDACPLGVADSTFLHLSAIGLVNAMPVKIVPGVAIPTHSPCQLAHAALALVEPPIAADDTEPDVAAGAG
jgi:hypothetical protein